jgi:two-component sensor histidine kinase
MEWRESGGPEVCAPQAKGFGTKLIERALPRKADNKVTLDYAPDGLVCRCRVELA